MKFIKLETTEGEYTFVNIDHILKMKWTATGTMIDFIDGDLFLTVKETPKDIIQKIFEQTSDHAYRE
jgi:uncharacterized protein YlzI (FlbEa/FlbD family)